MFISALGDRCIIMADLAMIFSSFDLLDSKNFCIICLSNISALSQPSEGYSNISALSQPNEGYSRHA
jgi:hypothetical protein